MDGVACMVRITAANASRNYVAPTLQGREELRRRSCCYIL
ncbi:hypothetical protein NT01EI_1926 [Edwardsiella ictaluri 93-146]|uniref:Uncharacterized protein n=1 Tax=Edwardsiella ictaluri (strain 93-146) TaxID=634503 RepID=C5B886_EDWI9|nr:hypothetical protein NT01EI_1926 [Edwardsiella ictaluri 93-146]